MRTWPVVAGFALALILFPAAGAAQGVHPLSLEVRAGAGSPTGDLREVAARRGFGFGATGIVHLMPRVGLYAAWERYAFLLYLPGWSGFPEADAETIDTGFSLGAQISLTGGSATGTDVVLRGGALYHKTEGRAETEGLAPVHVESDHTLGWEIGGGIGIPLGRVLTLTPAARYRTYSPGLGFLGETGEEEFSYFILDLGLAYRI